MPDSLVSSSPIISAVKWHWQHQHTLWLLLISSVLSRGSFRLFSGLFSTFVKRRLQRHDETSGAQALLKLHERYWSAGNEVVNHQGAAEQSPGAGGRTGRRWREQSSCTFSPPSSCQVSLERLDCSSALRLMGCVGAGEYVGWLVFEIAAILNTALQFNQSLVGFGIRIWKKKDPTLNSSTVYSGHRNWIVFWVFFACQTDDWMTVANILLAACHPNRRSGCWL